MDYEALKEQWSEVEDRDGVRLSWNVFPSTRMVSCSGSEAVFVAIVLFLALNPNHMILTVIPSHSGSIAPRRPHWRSLHAPQGEARHAAAAV